ncbi:hypothetical protein IQ268_17795 [Oculatella sp. LEGE 06141]|uniref:hypothetical protein n=1 Tax=Oculatella sp. LEGE 06141 TaxID=1828648 RepID=UPI00187E27AB|nr:hypothetical protein [Oculatella sp. LEGE 06141]MBE9180417.1 hypothetical protein [Oculatella sp. LEGE 06141]
MARYNACSGSDVYDDDVSALAAAGGEWWDEEVEPYDDWFIQDWTERCEQYEAAALSIRAIASPLQPDDVPFPEMMAAARQMLALETSEKR